MRYNASVLKKEVKIMRKIKAMMKETLAFYASLGERGVFLH